MQPGKAHVPFDAGEDRLDGDGAPPVKLLERRLGQARFHPLAQLEDVPALAVSLARIFPGVRPVAQRAEDHDLVLGFDSLDELAVLVAFVHQDGGGMAITLKKR